MANGFELQINTSYQDAKWLKGRGLQVTLEVPVPQLLAACDRAIMPGLSALRTNVAGIRAKSGRLRQSPGTKAKIYGRTATALVGFRSGVAPHAYYVEYGAKRKLRGSTAALKPLRRAFDSSRGAMAQIMAREMEALGQRALGSVR